MKRMGITPEDLESLSGEMMQAFGGAEELEDVPDDDGGDEDESGKTATFPFLNRLFGGNQTPAERQPGDASGSGREAKGFGKVTAVFGAVYNGLTGWFGDILSYSRLMALMLAGSVIAQVFNTLAAMPSSGGVTVVSMIVFIIIFLLGHLLNFGLNLLGCFVHDLRLQCLEFFGKFYVDGGKPFRPLEIKIGRAHV